MRRTQISIMAGIGAVLAGMAIAAVPLGMQTPADSDSGTHASVLALGGVATVTHSDSDGNVLSTQTVHNRLLDAGEDFILQQVFMDGSSNADTAQIGAICLSADDTAIAETLTASAFTTAHEADDDTVTSTTTSTIAATDTRECLTDSSVASSGQVATVGPLTFTANNTAADGSRSNWKPGVTIKMIGICQGFGDANAASCTAPLFAAVDINDVTLDVDETLTVTYTFDMTSSST